MGTCVMSGSLTSKDQKTEQHDVHDKTKNASDTFMMSDSVTPKAQQREEHDVHDKTKDKPDICVISDSAAKVQKAEHHDIHHKTKGGKNSHGKKHMPHFMMATTESSKRQHQSHEHSAAPSPAPSAHPSPSPSPRPSGHSHSEDRRHDATNSEKAQDHHGSFAGSMVAVHAARHMKTSHHEGHAHSADQTHDGHKESEHVKEDHNGHKEPHEEHKKHDAGVMLAANAAKKLHGHHLQLHEEALTTDKHLWV